MRKILTISFFVVMHTVQSQDPVFSQFYTSSLYLNPALSGLEEDIVVSMNYRSQWTGINLPFRTFQLSATHPILRQGVKSKHLGGFGGTLFSDQSGPNREITSTGLSVASSYNFHLNAHGNHIISAALLFGVIQKRINMDALQWSSQYSPAIGYDPSLPGETFTSERIARPVIHAGVAWKLTLDERHSKPVRMWYHGVAASNINRPEGFFMNEHEAPRVVYKVHGGYLHTFASGLELSPNYLIQHQHYTQLNVGAYAAYAMPAVTSKSIRHLKLSAGCWYRWGDGLILTTGMTTASWSAGFSYDTNSVSLQRTFQGANAFEVSFAYRIRVLREAKRFSTPLL